MDLKFAEIFAILCGVLLLGYASAKGFKPAAEPDKPIPLVQENTDLKKQLESLKEELGKLKIPDPHKPINQEAPIITLSENNSAFRFPSGSAQMSPEFQQRLLDDVFPKIQSNSQRYDCDVLMVIGHTDEVQVGENKRWSNLDDELTRAYATGTLDALHAGSNTDLGMVRALALVNFFRAHQELIPGIRYILPYSAGQMIQLNRSLSTTFLNDNNKGIPDETRRRIELQLTKSSAWTQ
jgi:outer membrane protein OmpA-like peptidoglycan-associated protein